MPSFRVAHVGVFTARRRRLGVPFLVTVIGGTERGNGATIAHVTTVASRDLRNHTADVLRQVADGTRVTITVNGKPVAEIGPVRGTRPHFLSKADLVGLVTNHQADAGLSRELQVLAGDTTDDLDQ